MLEYNKIKIENEDCGDEDLLKNLKSEVETREKTFLLSKSETVTQNFAGYRNSTKGDNHHMNSIEFSNQKQNYSNENYIPMLSSFKIAVNHCICF